MLFAGILVNPPARGQSIQWEWDGLSSRYWSLVTNWNPQDVPDASNETATIGQAGTYAVELNVSTTIQHLLITNPAATLDMWSNRTLTVTEWNGVTNYGTILGDSATSIVGVLINYGTYESPGGINVIDGPITNEAVSPTGIRIRGPSSLGLYGPTVTNNGTIQINYNAYAGFDPTYLHFKADTLLDGTGELIMGKFAKLATDTGVTLTQGADHTLRGQGTMTAAVVNEGAIRADDPTNWLTLDSKPIANNGTIIADAGCRLDFFGAYEISQDADGQILADGGTVNFKSTSTVTPLTVTGGKLGTSNGGVILAAAGDTKLIDVTNLGILNVDTAVVIAGGGITNDGTINVNPLEVPSFTHFVFVDNSELGGAGELILRRSFYSRLFVNAGFAGTNGVNHTIRGNGVIRGNLVNNGTIAPGMSIGLIDSLSPTTLTQGATGVIDIEVAGTSPSLYDRLTGPTSYVLDGKLRVSVLPPYVPALGHSYTIISGGSVSGTFAAIEGSSPGPGLDWALSYTSSTVVLSVVPCALEITEQPQTQTVCRGTLLSLSVTAPGATSYQWRLGGDEIEGATEPTLLVAAFALPLHTGIYDVIVSNSCDSLASDTASLFVYPGGSADTNGDGEVNGLDVQQFIDALLSPGSVDAGYCAADMNANGYVDISDLDGFAYYLLNNP